MDTMFTLKDAVLLVIFICIIIALIYAIILLKNLVVSIKHTNKILEDVEEISAVAKKRVGDVDQVIDGVSDSVANVTAALKGKENLIQSLASVGKAITSLVGVIKKKK